MNNEKLTGQAAQYSPVDPLAGGYLGDIVPSNNIRLSPIANWPTFPQSLALKLHRILRDSGYIKKDKRNSAQSYNYLSEEAMVKRLRELLIEHSVILIPDVIDCHTFQVEITTSKGNKSVPITRVTVRYTMVDADSGDSYSFSMVGEGTDTGDKAVYKALTGANKYALMKLFQIPSGDDPEADWGGDKDEEPEQPKPPKADQKTANFLSAVDNLLKKLPEDQGAKEAVALINTVLGGMGLTSLDEVTDSKDRRSFVDELRQAVATATGA